MLHTLLQIILWILVMSIISSMWWWMKKKVHKIGKKKVGKWLADYNQYVDFFKNNWKNAKTSNDLIRIIKSIFYFEIPISRIRIDQVDAEIAYYISPDIEFIEAQENLDKITKKNYESIQFMKSLSADKKYSDRLEALNKVVIEYITTLGKYMELRRYSNDDKNVRKRRAENKDFQEISGLSFKRAIYDEILENLEEIIGRIDVNISILVDIIMS